MINRSVSPREIACDEEQNGIFQNARKLFYVYFFCLISFFVFVFSFS